MQQNQSAAGAIALVTGANKGIGFEIARGLAERGATVYLGCRDEALGRAAAEKLSSVGNARAIALDVTNPATVQASAERIASECGRLDILVNNAGVALEDMATAKPSTVPLDLMRRIYEVNVFGVVGVTQAMLPLIAKSDRGRIVNVSSSLGSLALGTVNGSAASNRGEAAFWPSLLAYNSSKSAVNSVTVQFANELRASGIKVNAACPGYCATDLNGHSGPRSAAEGAQTPIRLATLPADGPTGGYFNDAGVIPW